MYDVGLGVLIDQDQTTFEEETTKDLFLGDVNNLILVLENTYHLLRTQKDGVIDLVSKGQRKRDDPEVLSTLNGLYAEMTKIELKVTYLKTKRDDLTKKWKDTVDTSV